MTLSIPHSTCNQHQVCFTNLTFSAFLLARKCKGSFCICREPMFADAEVNIRKIFWYLPISILCNLMWWLIKHYILLIKHWYSLFAWMEGLWPHSFITRSAMKLSSPSKYSLCFMMRINKKQPTLQILLFLCLIPANCYWKVIIQSKFLLIDNLTLCCNQVWHTRKQRNTAEIKKSTVRN